MGTNKLREMLRQITEKTGVKIDERKITNHSARRSAIMILNAADVPEGVSRVIAVDNDLEEFYSYPGNLYTHEPESKDNDDVVTNDDKHVNKLDVKITKSSTDSQQKSKLYAPFKSPLLKNPPNKESQKPLYEHQPTNQIINPNQEQNCLQVQSQAQNYPNLQVQSTRQ
ncbi:10269_t:CDS:2, partial [Gigaspora rosea]